MNLLERIRSDWRYIMGFRRLVAATADLTADSMTTLADEVEERIDQHGDRTFVEFEGATMRYDELETRANSFANWALGLGLKSGDCVALFMENEPDYIAFWIGMAKVGVRTALINSNLIGSGLVHCVNVVSARAVVCAPNLLDAVAAVKGELEIDGGVWVLGGEGEPEGASNLDTALAGVATTRPERAHRAAQRGADIALFIFTSGTTGLPKAAKITNSRALGLMRVFVAAVGVDASDRILLTLPLYHATGGMCGVGCAINSGGALILKRKFSASHFWREAVDSRATMLVYIGELGRYLMNLPPSPLEKQHSIVKGFGNGLREDVWREMVERTGIKRLVEFYGSTEGNVNFFNVDGKIGAVGRIPPLLRGKIRARIVRFDVETEIPVRGPNGFCIETKPGEVGEAVGPISNEPRERFEGYFSKEQTEKKILHNVFAEGDRYFRTGDLMKMDADGYIYFVDRVGDTFRWKSENVSTTEVEAALTSFGGVEHAIVYGVAVPHADGRAGMAAIVLNGEIDLEGLRAHLERSLPGYARPVFLRVKRETETTGTFKYRKVDLVTDGFDPGRTDEPLYFIADDGEGYRALDAKAFAAISDGQVRF